LTHSKGNTKGNRRAEPEQEAMLLGYQFFQDNYRQFARRLKGYWKT
jgi:hypothetical protein